MKKLILLLTTIPLIVFNSYFLNYNVNSFYKNPVKITDNILERKITGIVTDEKGDGIPGAIIRVKKNTRIGTITDFRGNYKLSKIPDDAKVLIFSFTGMETEEVQITEDDVINVTLKISNIEIENVVVTAIGISRTEKRIGYAVTTVNDESKNVKKNNESSKTWKRANNDVNAIKLFVGDNNSLPLKASQITVKIDGFRARVLIDCYFKNNKSQLLEGTFKMKLPVGATPYFFAFGSTSYTKNKKIPIYTYQQNEKFDLSPNQVMETRKQYRSELKEARVVPKEKAAFAYTETTVQQIDPALAEWAGADIFNCRVFPLTTGLNHIVIGYDVNLIDIGDDKIFNIYIPDANNTKAVDIDIANLNNTEIEIKPKLQFKEKNNRKYIHINKPKDEIISIRYKNPKAMLLTNVKEEKERYFATSFVADLPQTNRDESFDDVIIALDISASSNPDKFNVWIQMLEALLKNNQDKIKRFNVVFFNINTFWKSDEYIENTPKNIRKLVRYCNNLTLVGATDIGAVLVEASNPEWLTDETGKNIFLLSDGSATWGEDEFYAITSNLKKNDKIFVYNTGISGTDINLLEHLVRETNGAIFSIAGEDEIEKASKAFIYEPWKINNISFPNSEDILITGRPLYLYANQKIILSGRGNVKNNKELIISVEQKGKTKKLNVKFNDIIESELTNRIYGQIAVNQLESFDYLTEEFSIPYAVHFAIPGKTCSMLMLESENEYNRFDVKAKNYASVIKENLVGKIIADILNNSNNNLGNAKINFQNWLKKFEKTPNIQFSTPEFLSKLINKMPEEAFEINSQKLNCNNKFKYKMKDTILMELSKETPDYMIINNESTILSNRNSDDALVLLSTLIERNPSNAVMARDIAYSAMEWGYSQHVYSLAKRVIKSRPYEPQTFLIMAQILTKMNKIDLAVIYYEIALYTTWSSQYGSFKTITKLEYLNFLRMIKKGKYEVSFPEYIDNRTKELKEELKINTADLMIVITWNTDKTDIDLHVIEPSGEECYYSHKTTASGGELTADVTQGYGPEMYVIKNAEEGTYNVKAKYYSSDRNRTQTRTKVYAIIYENWGTDDEKITRKNITLEENKSMQDIIRIRFKK